MALKNYRIWFTHTSVGREGHPLSRRLRDAADAFGDNWPIITMDGDGYQVRDLRLVHGVWLGTFAKLRADAPHVIKADNSEEQLDLAPGDRLIDKCHFLYRTRRNVLVWQYSKNAGGHTRFERYLSEALEVRVALPLILNTDRLDDLMNGQVYELQFDFSRAAEMAGLDMGWDQNSMHLLNAVDAASARFKLTAPRRGSLARRTLNVVQQMVHHAGVQKVKVRLTDETDLIDVITSPLKDFMEVEMLGLYPDAATVFQALEAAYDRQRDRIANHRGGV